MNTQPALSILIPVHNNVDLTRACLESVFEHHAPALETEIIVIDDCSTDGTAAYLASLGQRVRSITNRTRCGFGENMNRAAALASSDQLLLLNNDTEVTPGWLRPLLEVSRHQSNTAVVGNRQLYASSGLINHAGIVFDRHGMPCHLYDGRPADFAPAQRRRRFQAVTGACWLVPRAVFAALNGFDPAFHNGFEDVDFCLRAARHGYSIWYAGDSVIYHHVSATQGRFHDEAANSAAFIERWRGRVLLDRELVMRQDGYPDPADDGGSLPRDAAGYRVVHQVLNSALLRPLWRRFLSMPGGLALARTIRRGLTRASRAHHPIL